MIAAAAYALPPFDWPIQDRDTAQWIETIPLYDGPWLLSATQAILNFRALSNDWDGAGSPPVAPAVVATAIEVLRRFGTVVEPMSHASPVPGGGVQLEWYLRDRYLEIEVLPNGSLAYLSEAAGQTKEAALSLADASAIRELVSFLSHR